jgi:superkiller protein 3
LGQNQDAIASYDNALAINPAFYPAWYSRGAALSHLGNYEAAVSSYDRALQIRPDFPDAQSRRNLALKSYSVHREVASERDVERDELDEPIPSASPSDHRSPPLTSHCDAI